MVTTPQSLDRQPATLRDEPSTNTGAVRLNVRFAAYLIDSAVLLGFILALFALAGLILWLSSDLGRNDPPDAAYYAFIAVFIGGTLIGWSAFNLSLATWRGQTPGHYLLELRIVSEEGAAPTRSRLLLRWFALHPLLFHPLLAPVWALFTAITVSLTLSQIVLALTLGLVALCVIAPLATLATVLLDSEHRALHDRIAGTMVCPATRKP